MFQLPSISNQLLLQDKWRLMCCILIDLQLGQGLIKLIKESSMRLIHRNTRIIPLLDVLVGISFCLFSGGLGRSMYQIVGTQDGYKTTVVDPFTE